MNKVWAWTFAALALAGCTAEKIPITGTRVPVVNYESTVKVDQETKGTIVALPISEIGRDWPQCGGGADHAMPHFSLNDNLEPHWSVSVGSGNGSGRFLSSPIVNEGEVYSLDTYGMVTAFHASSGESFWDTNISPEDRNEPIIGGGLAYGAGKIFVTSPHAEVLALDAKTGKILWRHTTQSPIRAAPTFADGRLFCPGNQ